MTFDTGAWLASQRGQATLLGVCPMSADIVEATIREAAAESGYIPMFIATPRQVDADRGYTGWSQDALIGFIEDTADDIGYDGPVVIARDHGGPYQSTRDRGKAEVDLETAMSYSRELFIDDLDAGFDILHVDATEDATVDGALDLDEVTRRTVDLIESIESHRESADIDRVYYEVGTEEITGGMTAPEDFERYIEGLKAALRNAGRGDVIDSLLFVVGQIGTTMQIDMENAFDPAKARELTDIVEAHDVHLKVHYADWLDDTDLARFPELGIGAANVGPEFAAAMVEGYASLEAEEVASVPTADRSKFMETFEAAAVRDAPWQKFAPDHLTTENEDAYAEEQKRNIAYCVGRYVFNDPAVASAREQLFANIRDNTDVDPHAHVVEQVQETIHRYVTAFNLHS